MYVKEIIRYSKADKEAELCISDGDYSIICYAYPIHSVVVNQQVRALYAYECVGIVKSLTDVFCIHKLSQYYAYSVTAKVVSKKDSIVQVGRLIIILDDIIPNDIYEGEYISFSVRRFDI